MARHVHLVNPLTNACGGSEMRTVGLFEELNELCEVSLWASESPDSRFLGRYPIRPLDMGRALHPVGGVQVFAGVFFPWSTWLSRTKPDRVIAIYNTYDPHLLASQLEEARRQGAPEVEVAFVSEAMRTLTPGIPGVIQHSPIDLNRFSPLPLRDPKRPYTIGRMSRDVPEKHHPDDHSLYKRLAEAGCHVKIMGGSAIEKSLAGAEGIEIIPEGAEDAAGFLRSLDCFFFRTHPALFEASGRVISEAMACGLAIVCENRGGYPEILEDGANALLFDPRSDPYPLLIQLKNDPFLARELGLSARKAVEDVLGPQSRRRELEFYLR